MTTIGRHRSTELWGEDANQFNPDSAFEDDELWHDQVYAARNPHSRRFSPFTHTPRDCIGKSAYPTPLVCSSRALSLTRSMLVADFAQMEMRTILTQLFKNFTFELSEKEKSAPTTEPGRGGNNGQPC